MKSICNTLVAIFLLALMSCELSKSEWSDNQKKQVMMEARQMLSEYNADIAKEGLTAEFKYLDSSPDFFWVPPGFTESISYDSVASILRKTAPTLKSINNVWDTLKITPITTETAAYNGKLTSISIDSSGNRNENKLIETGILIKRKDGWKLLCGQTAILK
jgi:SnoaL-like domain